MWTPARDGAITLRALVVPVLAVLVSAGLVPAMCSLTASTGWAQDSTTDDPATPPVGSLVVALRSLGQVDAILPNGEVLVLARSLAEPTGVAVLSDGTVLVAEVGANRVSGFGGRLGATPQPLLAIDGPTGLAVISDDRVVVTATGQVGVLRVTGWQYQPLSTDFVTPGGPAVRGGQVVVPDFATGRVATIDLPTGAAVTTIASDLRNPAGAASAPDLPVFVSEAQGNTILRVDPAGGAPTLFATVEGPLQLALDPVTPGPDDDWTLVVSSVDGIVRLDPDGRVTDRTSLPLTSSAVVFNPVRTSDDGATAPGVTAVLKDDPSESSSSLAVIVILVVLAALAAIVATIWFARRAGRRQREDGELMPPPPSPPPPSPPPPPSSAPSGPEGPELAAVVDGCADEEAEVERLQDLLRHVRAQLGDAQNRGRRAAERASDSRDRAMRALEVRTSLQTARAAAEPQPESEKFTWAQLSFSTDAGRQAFEAFRRREIDATALKARLVELGEDRAMTQIAEEGRRRYRADPTVPWPEEQSALRDAIAAREELHGFVKDADEAQAEVDRLTAREAQLGNEVNAARRRLDACRGTNTETASTD